METRSTARDQVLILLIVDDDAIDIEFVALPAFPDKPAPPRVVLVSGNDVPIEMRTAVSQTLIVHVVGMEDSL
jgi:hypothetical protein